MQIKFFILVLFLLGHVNQVFAQDDPVLFTVGKTPVHVSEFSYIYSKTNGEKADFSKASVEEYLDLYAKFKLKVEKAKELEIDTIPSLQRELEGYRRQLSNSYLMDKQVKDRLLREAYERQKTDVKVSHIMIPVKGRKQAKDSIVALNKINEAYKALENGSSFEEVVKNISEDSYSKPNAGVIGWITAILPSGFYEMENAAYETKTGKYSKPIITKMGYHIIKVNETRKARGTVELSHILVRKDDKNPEKDPKKIIDEVYTSLKSGGDFDALSRKFSDDKKSASKGGYLGFYGIGVSEPNFENTAFSLEKDGDYSAPIQTSAGWHILRRVSKPDLGTYEVEKNRLQVKIEKDARFQEARIAMIKNIKKQGMYRINDKTYQTFLKSLDKDFLSHKWRAPRKSESVLFTFGEDSNYDLGGFTDFLLRSSRQRNRLGKKKSIQEVLDALLVLYSDDMALEYEKSQLANKYPDFKSLMREYEEGILLFEVTKMLVWDKASQDTVGLKAFYAKNSDNYLYNERGEVSVFTLKSQSEKIISKARKLAKKKSSSDVLRKINKKGNLLTVDKRVIEKGKNKYDGLNDVDWKKGVLSNTEMNDDNTITFTKIEKMLPREKKTLAQARGYVIADYQDELEKQWIEELRKVYPIKINEEVLSNLIK